MDTAASKARTGESKTAQRHSEFVFTQALDWCVDCAVLWGYMNHTHISFPAGLLQPFLLLTDNLG